ncbi:MAG: hypothetical protein IGS03_00580 [Candidatus Sericytochromatia bacterium]|nr:hypothetical protein [Candidatus Sericytochromatia bacterium]
MAITWTTRSTGTETEGPFALTTTVRTGGVSGGYLTRVDRETTYDSRALPVALRSALVFCPAGSPASISWSEQFSDTRTDGDTRIVEKTFVGTPLDGMDNPIGSGRIWRHEKTFYYQDQPMVGAEIALAWVP